MSPALEGTVIGARYRLERPLGQGGMGAVWAATHVVTGKVVALKFLSDPAADESSRKRLVREARAACSVSHPHVVQVHDVFELEGGMPVLVMDLLQGESLGDRLEREGKIPVDELLHLLLPIVSALEAAHAQGVVHRDIKPDNVFLVRRSDGTVDVRVLDFGIAKVTKLDDGTETAKLTGTGAMMGTPYYMAPEQVFGEKDVDARTDVWALGVLIYECLAGVRPTEGANLGQILKLVTVGPFKPLSSEAPELPAAITRIVDGCLQRDREKRTATATLVREALERFLANTTLDGAAVTAATAGESNRARTKPRRRWPVPAALAAAALATLAVGGHLLRAPKAANLEARAGVLATPVQPASDLPAPAVAPAPAPAPAPVPDLSADKSTADTEVTAKASPTPKAPLKVTPNVASLKTRPHDAKPGGAVRGEASPAKSTDRGPGGVVLTAPAY